MRALRIKVTVRQIILCQSGDGRAQTWGRGNNNTVQLLARHDEKQTKLESRNEGTDFERLVRI